MYPFLSLQSAWMRLFWDAQLVIALRLARITALSPVAQREMLRMSLEKGPAFWAAGVSAQTALLAGKPPATVARAALRPVARKARANRRRLTR